METKKAKKPAPVFRLAREEERDLVINFINENFDWRLPLINRPEYFDFYYRTNGLQFAIAELEGKYAAVCGYILTNRYDDPDIWASVFVARKDCSGIGIRLMAELGKLTNSNVVACNNIRENTLNLYRFLGWTAERISHYYRIAEKDALSEYKLCRPETLERLPAEGDLTLKKVREKQIDRLPFPETDTVPRKDPWYLKRRYFHFPHQDYDVWSVREGKNHLAYLVTRAVASGEEGEIPVLRIVDYIGPSSVIPRMGYALDELMNSFNAEYMDCYNVGIPPDIWNAAGLTERTETSKAIIPNYLTPPLYENTEYYYFTNTSDHFVLFKADGDQDRPNLQ